MKQKQTGERKMKKSLLALILTLSILLVGAVGVGVTLSLLKKTADPVENTFIPDEFPEQAAASVVETFTNNVKKNVTVKNEGNKDAYLRIQLLSYRVNEQSAHIGGKAPIPSFTPGTGWLSQGEGIYIYAKPVAAGESAPYLIGSTGIELVSYTDMDGGRQVVEVIGESISVDAVAAWNVNVAPDGTLSLK